MEIWYSESAFRHGITEDQIQYLLDHYQGFPFLAESARDPGEYVDLYVGDDARRQALEVIGRPHEDEDAPGSWGVHVFHADRLRRGYRPYYEEQMLWQHVE